MTNPMRPDTFLVEPGRSAIPIPRRIDKCRACGSGDLTEVLDLGEQIVSCFPSPGDPVPAPVPLRIVLCAGCSLAQQLWTVPAELLYARHYWYRSGTNEAMREALRDVVATASASVDLRPDDVVLDIGSNDGTLLRCWSRDRMLLRVGCEPARNLRQAGDGVHALIDDFWSAEAYWRKTYDVFGARPKAKVITAIGMLYDLDDPVRFLRDCAEILADDGAMIAQLMMAKQMADSRDVGNLCHEHLEFWTFDSLGRAAGEAGLEIFDAEENGTNGGSCRVLLAKRGGDGWATRPAFRRDGRGAEERLGGLRRKEDDLFLDSPAGWEDFRDDIEENRREVRETVAGFGTVGTIGASTKGNVMLQYWGLGPERIAFASDRQTEKWGRTMANGVPIIPEAEARARRPDAMLVLPYGFRAGIVAREAGYREAGGKLILPLPECEVVS